MFRQSCNLQLWISNLRIFKRCIKCKKVGTYLLILFIAWGVAKYWIACSKLVHMSVIMTLWIWCYHMGPIEDGPYDEELLEIIPHKDKRATMKWRPSGWKTTNFTRIQRWRFQKIVTFVKSKNRWIWTGLFRNLTMQSEPRFIPLELPHSLFIFDCIIPLSLSHFHYSLFENVVQAKWVLTI
jgi:hypothetical protein